MLHLICIALALSTMQPATPPKAPDKPADTKAASQDPASPIPFPHPLITEVLYAVPSGDEGDANMDGKRHVAGDEFIELINPHDKPIQLLGYSITDRNPAKKGQLKFTFPALELPPHAVVVVFNGFEQTWAHAGPVGDAQRAPAGPSPKFHGAYVFTMRNASSRASWANSGDFALLSDPNNVPVHCVSWGSFKETLPHAILAEQAPLTAKGSVQRESLGGAFGVHPMVDGTPAVSFSPGVFEFQAAKPANPPETPKDTAESPKKPGPPANSKDPKPKGKPAK